MYIETSRTITETVMFALINMSSRKLGSGMIMAITMPSTASGTLSSAKLPSIFPVDFGGFVLGEDGTRHLRPDQLLPVLWQEVKALRTRISELEKRA